MRCPYCGKVSRTEADKEQIQEEEAEDWEDDYDD